ncbi:MAG TPA: hypothetical protein PK874_06350 [Desulfobacteraceae bacterium]|nr:hypothetical protein [Desulfobacteraceae bacterium]HPJ66649.1 hypothetical protein [Desulfobacteraceae bacterium]HPQ27768.1 hypothetical protein [Desulfobacteraceae bacterium]
MNKIKIKAIAGVIIVFFLGTIIGALGTGIFIRHKIRQFTSGEHSFQYLMMRRLSRELKLTDEQIPEVREIVAQSAEEMRKLFKNSHSEFIKIMERKNTRLKEVLTPDQQKQLDNMFERIQRHWCVSPVKEQGQ